MPDARGQKDLELLRRQLDAALALPTVKMADAEIAAHELKYGPGVILLGDFIIARRLFSQAKEGE